MIKGIIYKTDKPYYKCHSLGKPKREIFSTDNCYYPLIKALRDDKARESTSLSQEEAD